MTALSKEAARQETPSGSWQNVRFLGAKREAWAGSLGWKTAPAEIDPLALGKPAAILFGCPENGRH